MINKKIMTKMTSAVIAVLLVGIPSMSNPISYASQSVYVKGNVVTRYYGSSTSKTTESGKNVDASNVNNTGEITNSANTNTVTNNTNANSNLSYAGGRTITRYYGSNIQKKLISDKSQTAQINNNSTPSDKDIIENNTYTNKNMYYAGGSTVTRYYGSNSLQNTNKDDSLQEKNNLFNGENLTQDETEKLVLKMSELINSERKLNNLNPLILDNPLSTIAQLKAEDMVKYDYFSHNSPNYGMPYDMISNMGIKYENATENIAKDFSIESAHINLMNSAIHKRAILFEKFTHVGIGIDKGSDGMYNISVMFITK